MLECARVPIVEPPNRGEEREGWSSYIIHQILSAGVGSSGSVSGSERRMKCEQQVKPAKIWKKKKRDLVPQSQLKSMVGYLAWMVCPAVPAAGGVWPKSVRQGQISHLVCGWNPPQEDKTSCMQNPLVFCSEHRPWLAEVSTEQAPEPSQSSRWAVLAMH